MYFSGMMEQEQKSAKRGLMTAANAFDLSLKAFEFADIVRRISGAQPDPRAERMKELHSVARALCDGADAMTEEEATANLAQVVALTYRMEAEAEKNAATSPSPTSTGS